VKVCISCACSFNAFDWRCPSCEFTPPINKGFPSLAPAERSCADTGFDSEEFRRLAAVEAESFWFQARNKLIIWALQKYFPNAQSLLEIGCGTGFVLSGIKKAYPKLSLYGSELSADGLGLAAQRLPGVPLMQMNALSMPFFNEFDVVGSFDVLEHIESDIDVLKQIYKSVSPGGGVLLTVPQHGFLWSHSDKLAGHFRRYSRPEMRRKLELAGFQVEFATSFVSVLLPILFLQRAIAPVQSNEKAAEALKPNKFVNNALGFTLDMERSTIKAGLSWPAGGSLLVVARRYGY
jgi:SAM-dependent methyltransferase